MTKRQHLSLFANIKIVMASYKCTDIESATTKAAIRLGYCLRENQMRAIVQFVAVKMYVNLCLLAQESHSAKYNLKNSSPVFHVR